MGFPSVFCFAFVPLEKYGCFFFLTVSSQITDAEQTHFMSAVN